MQVFVIEDFIDQDKCIEFLELVKTKTRAQQDIMQDSKITQEFYALVKDKLESLGLGISGMYDDITLSARKRPITQHYDKKLNACKYKLLIYLNDLNSGGGTIFHSKGKTLTTNCKAGNAVVFDIGLLHEGEPSSKEQIKYTIGFRLKTN